MTKGEAWDIVAGLVESIDVDDLTQLVEKLDDMLTEQEEEDKK